MISNWRTAMSGTRNVSKAKASKTRKTTGKARTKRSGHAATSRKHQDSSSRVKTVRDEFGLKQTQMSRMLGISARKLSELESQSKDPRPETNRRLTEIERLQKALDEIMDAGDIAAWLVEPNDAFDGSTPLQVVERGEVDRLWQMIFAIRTGHPM